MGILELESQLAFVRITPGFPFLRDDRTPSDITIMCDSIVHIIIIPYDISTSLFRGISSLTKAIEKCGRPLDLYTHSYFHHTAPGTGPPRLFLPKVTVLINWLLDESQATATGDLIQLPYIPLNGAAFIAGTYLLTYFLMEPVAGASMIPFVGVMLWYLNKLHIEHGSQAILVAG